MICISFLFLKEPHVSGLSSMYYPCRSLQLAAGTAQRGMWAEIYKHASGTAAPGSLGSIHLPGPYISLHSSTLANAFLISRVLPCLDKCA